MIPSTAWNSRVGSSRLWRLRAAGKMTCPSTMGVELATNPFLRTGSAEIREVLGLQKASDGEVFAELRERKNSFR